MCKLAVAAMLTLVPAAGFGQGPGPEGSADGVAIRTLASPSASHFVLPLIQAAFTPGVPQFSQKTPVPKRSREDALRASAGHYRNGVALLEQDRLPDARAELDRALESLLNSTIDFTSDQVARRELDRMVQEIHRLEVTRMGIAETSEAPVYDQPPIEEIPELTFTVDPSLETTVIDQVRARSGEFPLEVNETVLSFVRYFTSERGKRTFIAGYRRSGRYRDMIFRILDEEGLPRELLHLAQAESGFQPRAMSWAKAGGLWQFVPFRGKEYGLHQTALTDDRFDPEKATRAAARHLRDLYHEFGDWNLAMAAYNCGPGCVGRAVERTGYADFWELRRRNAIPRETTNYVPIVQALAIIALNPSAYGIELPEADAPLDFDSHQLDAKTNLHLAADLLGVSKAELRELNPAVNGDVAPAGYTLRVPKNGVPSLVSGLSQIPETNRVAWRAHRVSDGDTIQAIASQYKTTEAAIVKANEVSGVSVHAGDMLLIPAAYTPTSAPRATAANKPVAKKRATTNRTRKR